MSRYERPRRISADDVVASFDCGVEVLDTWLREHALASDRSGMTSVYVTTTAGRVVGYYGLRTSMIEHEDAIAKVGRGMPRHPIPALLISRFAVDIPQQGHGLGRQLLRDALVRVVKVADDVGVRALHVHAKNPQARAVYASVGFMPSPVDHAHLQLPIKTIRASLGATSRP